MDLAEQTPPEQSIADARAAHETDARLIAGAERNRVTREAKAARGEPSTVAEMIESRFGDWRASLKAAVDTPPERAVRLMPSEGDPPTIADKFRRGMVPERFWNPNGAEPFVATLDNYIPKTPHQQKGLEAATLWLARARAGESAMLALVGPQGTGKSHLLYACANALLDDGIKLYARPWYVLADELRYGGHHPVTGAEIDAADVRRALMRPPWGSKVWALDEVRPTSGTAFDDMELTKLACHAYDRRYPVFITSNVNPLSDVMGAPAASRFREIVIDGPDARRA